MNKLIDINEVCKLLNTTSRTLRFYEEKGLIESSKEQFSNRRKYSNKQLEKIRNILVLRALGLSIKTIKSLQQADFDLKSAVLERKAAIYASIDTKIQEIDTLNEAITTLENGSDLFNLERRSVTQTITNPHLEIVNNVVAGILDRNFSILNKYLSDKMQEYIPENVFWKIWDDTTIVCGKFIALDRISADKYHQNVIYQYINYEKIGLKIRFVFYDDKISGLWLNYYEV